MILLNATTKSLEVKLAGVVATTQLPFVAGYVDVSQTSFAMSAAAENDGTTNDTTAVTVAAAPAASTTRQVKFLSAFNADTAAATLTVQVNNNGTPRVVWKGTLAVGDTLIYVDGRGFAVTDLNGQVKTGPTVVSLTSGVTGVLPAANGGTGQSSYAVGDLLYASASGTLARRAAVATGSVFASQGVGVAADWTATPTISGNTRVNAILSLNTGVLTSAAAGDLVIPNAKAVRAVNAAGDDTAIVVGHNANHMLVARGGPNSVANDGTKTLSTTGSAQGLLTVWDATADQVAVFVVSGSTVTELSDPSGTFSAVKDTASSSNLYVELGNLVLQNKTGATHVFAVQLLGGTL